MSRIRRALAWLKLRERPISSGVALMSFAIALLSMVVAAFQAALLYSQRATPYRTAVYARQLEVAEAFAGAAHQQHLRFINLYNDCVHRLNGEVGSTSDYLVLAQDFRNGAQALHIAYGATLSTFPSDIHDEARDILMLNESLFDNVVAPSADCHGFHRRAQSNDGMGQANQIYVQTGEMVNGLRVAMGVDQLSWPAPVREIAD